MQHNFTQPELNSLWTDYNQMRLRGDKQSAKRLLTNFIALLKQADPDSRQAFVDTICQSILDQTGFIANNGTEVSGQPIRIQHSLFREIILPVLSEQYSKNSAIHIRWIAQFEQFFYADHRMTQEFLQKIEALYPFDSISFLKKSYAISANAQTLDMLLQRMQQDIEFAIHEMPVGVLVEPVVFTQMIQSFKDHWEESAQQEKWQLRLKDWVRIAALWQKYHEGEHQAYSFEDFTQENGPEGT
ncbi:MAG: hypothetical protein AAF206_06970 [Bacteroidota bacterium]